MQTSQRAPMGRQNSARDRPRLPVDQSADYFATAGYPTTTVATARASTYIDQSAVITVAYRRALLSIHLYGLVRGYDYTRGRSPLYFPPIQTSLQWRPPAYSSIRSNTTYGQLIQKVLLYIENTKYYDIKIEPMVVSIVALLVVLPSK